MAALQRRVFDGKIYGLVSIPLHKTKSSALARAKRYRKSNFNARVLKTDFGYAVYARKK